MTISREKIENELKWKLSTDGEVWIESKKFAEEVKDHWVNKEAPSPWNPHPLTKTGPYATGDYAESIQLEQRRNRSSGRFMPGFRVYTLHPNAHFIEYGTKIDNPDSRSPWGRFTPTPEFACAAKTAHHFRGTAP